MEGKDVEFSQLKELETSNVNEEMLSVIYMGIYHLLKLAIRLPLVSLKPEVSNCPKDCHRIISSLCET